MHPPPSPINSTLATPNSSLLQVFQQPSQHSEKPTLTIFSLIASSFFRIPNSQTYTQVTAVSTKTVIALMEMVREMVAQSPVVIFSRSTCCISHSIKTLIQDFGSNPAVCELDEIPRSWEIEQALAQLGCNPVVPTVFIGGELVGGAKEVMSLHLNRSLKPKLKKAGALWV